jgi:hypothetical protein
MNMSEFLNKIDAVRARMGATIYDPDFPPRPFYCKLISVHSGQRHAIWWMPDKWQSATSHKDGELQNDNRIAALICGKKRDEQGVVS